MSDIEVIKQGEVDIFAESLMKVVLRKELSEDNKKFLDTCKKSKYYKWASAFVTTGMDDTGRIDPATIRTLLQMALGDKMDSIPLPQSPFRLVELPGEVLKILLDKVCRNLPGPAQFVLKVLKN